MGAKDKPSFYIVAAELADDAHKNAVITLKDPRHDHVKDTPLTGGKNRLLNVLNEVLSVNIAAALTVERRHCRIWQRSDNGNPYGI